MCWQCDHPDRTQLDYLDHMRDLITTFGWAIQGVERSGPHPPWAYTVGLTTHNRPELVATGMPIRPAHDLLNGPPRISCTPPFPGRASRSRCAAARSSR